MALGMFKRLAQGLTRTRENLQATLHSVVGSPKVDDETLDDLEANLLAADLGIELSGEVMAVIRTKARRGQVDGDNLRTTVIEALRASMATSADRGTVGDAVAETPLSPREGDPHVVFVVGVNGGGKTTTVGKLAARDGRAGHKVMVVAADTFRAAAIEQLERWSERAGAELSRQRDGADPAAVVFDALKSAKARGITRVYVDTAGRLHTKTNLMAELAKLGRVADREVPGAPHEVLLVVDATTGQNGLNQASEFTRAATLTGVVLTKLDGTAKGGVALGIHRALGVPVRYVGVGETLEDLLEFDADAFLEGLVGDEETRTA